MSCAVPKLEMRLSQVSASQMRSSVSRNVQEFVGEKTAKKDEQALVTSYQSAMQTTVLATPIPMSDESDMSE